MSRLAEVVGQRAGVWSDGLCEQTALVPLERLAGPLMRRRGFRANQRERLALAFRDVGHVAPVGFDDPVQNLLATMRTTGCVQQWPRLTSPAGGSAPHGHPGQRGTRARVQRESWANFGIANGGLRVGHGSGDSGDLLGYYAGDGAKSRSHSERQGPHPYDPAMRDLLHAVDAQPNAAESHGRPGGSEASPRLSVPIQFILKLSAVGR